MRRLLSVLLSLSILWPLPAYPWWETGHQVVARIAAAHLTSAARTRLARILDVPDTPDAIAEALAKASTWADETKNETKTGSWHYIDLAIQDHKSDIPGRCKDDNCAPVRIRLFAEQLAGHPAHPANTQWSQLDALRYLVHLVGDIHQPLHTISDADLGGNCELLDPLVGKAKNLHALWDGEIIDEINASDKALADELDAAIEDMGPHREHVLSEGKEDDWVWESHELAIRDIYRRLRIPVEPVEFPASCAEAPEEIRTLKLEIPGAYVSEMKPVVREQLIKGGLRLARLLNESL
ncbi:MAG: S1/P1 nuclease [Acidobacteriaceae bacterium]|nr:S1/P1 nuclease [Acidobacteriaceae bacterium]